MSCGEESDTEGAGTSRLNSPDHGLKTSCVKGGTHSYELGKLTSGQAAALCGKGRVDFLLSLPRVGVSISNLRPEDAEVEIEFIRHG